jgi:hypothetical protein
MKVNTPTMYPWSEVDQGDPGSALRSPRSHHLALYADASAGSAGPGSLLIEGAVAPAFLTVLLRVAAP